MAKKRKTLPKEIQALLEAGDIGELKRQLALCEPNAVTGKYGSNIFSLSPLPRRYMEIVRIHCLVRGKEHYRLRLQVADGLRRLMVCIDCLLDFPFFTAAHIGYDERRMGHHESR